jgi:translocation protein SEC63
LRPSTDDDALAPRIKTDYKSQHADVVESLRNAQKRRQRRIKRALVVVLGWAIMGGMVYLIMVTQRTILKIWNPYDILGISDVSHLPV